MLGARIFAIADTMDAIMSDRPYRKGQPLSVAKAEIKRCTGSQFDPTLVEVYLDLPDDTWLDIRQMVEGMETADLIRYGAGASRPSRNQTP